MGIRWVCESKRTKRVFLWTFILPFIGGFLYAKRGAAALAMLPVGLIMVVLSQIAATEIMG